MGKSESRDTSIAVGGAMKPKLENIELVLFLLNWSVCQFGPLSRGSHL